MEQRRLCTAIRCLSAFSGVGELLPLYCCFKRSQIHISQFPIGWVLHTASSKPCWLTTFEETNVGFDQCTYTAVCWPTSVQCRTWSKVKSMQSASTFPVCTPRLVVSSVVLIRVRGHFLHPHHGGSDAALQVTVSGVWSAGPDRSHLQWAPQGSDRERLLRLKKSYSENVLSRGEQTNWLVELQLVLKLFCLATSSLIMEYEENMLQCQNEPKED